MVGSAERRRFAAPYTHTPPQSLKSRLHPPWLALPVAGANANLLIVRARAPRSRGGARMCSPFSPCPIGSLVETSRAAA
eukprot:2262776-Prymnesium_polylepis.2